MGFLQHEFPQIICSYFSGVLAAYINYSLRMCAQYIYNLITPLIKHRDQQLSFSLNRNSGDEIPHGTRTQVCCNPLYVRINTFRRLLIVWGQVRTKSVVNKCPQIIWPTQGCFCRERLLARRESSLGANGLCVTYAYDFFLYMYAN